MEHKGTKRIETPRLDLRPFIPEDADAVYRNWASEPEVTRYLTWDTHTSTDITKQVLADWVGGYRDPGFYLWAIELKQTAQPIGSIAAVGIDEKTESVTIGYCIGTKWWGRGIMPEALGAVISFFFEEVGANCVNACHDPRNPNSGKVMKKCGMKFEGIRRQAGRNNQGVCDEAWHSILRREYFEKKGFFVETGRLMIREFTADMARDVHLNSLDEDNRRFVPDEVFGSKEEALKTVKSLIGRYGSADGPFVYPVFLKDGMKNIGYVQLAPIAEGFEIGYHVAKAHTGNGYATEAVSAFLPVIAEKRGLDWVYGICLAENKASVRVLEKCGFELMYRGQGVYHGEEREIARYVLKLPEPVKTGSRRPA
ncbi:MAG: GNAT family N-acetyltransferase [Clostridiales bacterium]|nr:GNAT family N-acetyltransferase [Clostridiales bacterium]